MQNIKALLYIAPSEPFSLRDPRHAVWPKLLADARAELTSLEQRKVWIVSLEWNQPPSEVTGDTGIVGVFEHEGAARQATDAAKAEWEDAGYTVWQFTNREGRYCIGCGEPHRTNGKEHTCTASPDAENFCDYCGAELKENGGCDNDHDEWDIDVHCTEHEVKS